MRRGKLMFRRSFIDIEVVVVHELMTNGKHRLVVDGVPGKLVPYDKPAVEGDYWVQNSGSDVYVMKPLKLQ